jgi:hypothetical protein
MSTPATTRIRKPFPNRGRTILLHWMAPMLFWLAATLSCPASDPAIRLRPVLTTNYVVITNIVIVTNYVPVTADHPAPDPTTSSPTSPPPTGLDWAPPPDDFDWIQLKSGEWLKGRLKAMQERKLEFDSEKLDDLTFDWKDIRQLRSPRARSPSSPAKSGSAATHRAKSPTPKSKASPRAGGASEITGPAKVPSD